jgi:hypothetical protein
VLWVLPPTITRLPEDCQPVPNVAYSVDSWYGYKRTVREGAYYLRSHELKALSKRHSGLSLIVDYNRKNLFLTEAVTITIFVWSKH